MKQLTDAHFGVVKSIVKKLTTVLTAAHERILKTIVFPLAVALAEKKLPAQSDESYEHYIDSIRSEYQSLKHTIAIELKGGAQKVLAMLGISQISQRISECTQAIQQEADIIRNLLLDKNRIATDYNKHTILWCNILLLVFAGGEIVLNISTFLFIGDIVLFAMFIGAVVAIAQVYAAKVTSLAIRDLVDPLKQKRYCAYACVGFTLFSMGLGGLRYYFLHQTTGAAIPFFIVNPFLFASLNMLFIVSTFIITWLFQPDKINRDRLAKIKELELDIQKHNKTMTELTKEREGLKEYRTLMSKIHVQIMHDQKMLYKMVDSLYASAIGSFKSENILKRSGQEVPECFKARPEPLEDIEEETPLFTENSIEE